MGLQKIKQNLNNNHQLQKHNGDVSSPLDGRTSNYSTRTNKTSVGVNSVMDSKSSKMLFTAKKTTQMKRTKPTATTSNLCMTSSNSLNTCDTNMNENDLAVFNVKSDSNKTAKTLNRVSLKEIGISISNILKPNVSGDLEKKNPTLEIKLLKKI